MECLDAACIKVHSEQNAVCSFQNALQGAEVDVTAILTVSDSSFKYRFVRELAFLGGNILLLFLVFCSVLP